MGNNNMSESLDRIGHVDGVLNYLADRNEKPVSYTYQPPPGVPPRTGNYVKHTMPIYDGRALADRITLDRHGFAIVHQRSAVANFYDDSEIRAIYYPEVERLVKESTGAARVLVFDHNVRNRAKMKEGAKGISEPVKVAHNDYTLKSGPQRVRDLLPGEAEALLKNRYAFINVWRPISVEPVQESPLAVCDAQSVALEDFVPHVLKYRDRDGEVYSVAYNPNHKWYYIPHQRNDEVLLLKCYDSDGRAARFTAHSAFADPTSPPDAPSRESIEARTIAFFAP
ncbi:MAG: CmcJ/NvfI family oxidoreductase [Candidatus Binatus sp.]|uniref:CmcJ/NvfI family oxidoreductase n=1 Tax=Candidatus Binatus sp. TaxID=2811406 RepID=UPI0027202EF5|nr:CmcJ/NvfI family oxidoreductase [Candidatus Binatus sp.]MDO8431580.1 CmcJ/NvfI family oxidoreductase [Candidatus Binatus sp.]